MTLRAYGICRTCFEPYPLPHPCRNCDVDGGAVRAHETGRRSVSRSRGRSGNDGEAKDKRPVVRGTRGIRSTGPRVRRIRSMGYPAGDMARRYAQKLRLNRWKRHQAAALVTILSLTLTIGTLVLLLGYRG